jgi:hypothetical protein
VVGSTPTFRDHETQLASLLNLVVELTRGQQMGVKSDIEAISATSMELASDQADLNALQVQVDAKAAEIEGDTTASAAADAQLSADLLAGGPKFVLNADGSVGLYQYAATPPGYTITMALPAD